MAQVNPGYDEAHGRHKQAFSAIVAHSTQKMRLFRKRKTVCLFLLFLLVVLILTLTNILNISYDVNTDSLMDVIPAPDTQPVPGQLRYLDFVIQDNVTSRTFRCTPVHNIAFVKTHKAGSSTVANILTRYGQSNNLTFALPNTVLHSFGYNYISKPGQVLSKKNIIPIPEGKEYNILFNHAIYNRTAFRQIMPQNTAYITILREPFQQFVSAFEYYHLERSFAAINPDILKAANPISEYLKNPYRYEKGVIYYSFAKNKQAQDLGFGREEFFKPDKMKEYISQMDKDFTLVMIMEHFDESLLLLKHEFCWQIKDILYIQRNKNIRKPQRNFTEVDHQRHRKISRVDYAIYSHYREILSHKIQTHGRDFLQELSHFKSILEQVNRSCVSRTSLFVAANRWHDEFQVTASDCNLLLSSELGVLDKLLRRAQLQLHGFHVSQWKKIHSLNFPRG